MIRKERERERNVSLLWKDEIGLTLFQFKEEGLEDHQALEKREHYQLLEGKQALYSFQLEAEGTLKIVRLWKVESKRKRCQDYFQKDH